jgi:hypothetical protein
MNRKVTAVRVDPESFAVLLIPRDRIFVAKLNPVCNPICMQPSRVRADGCEATAGALY